MSGCSPQEGLVQRYIALIEDIVALTLKGKIRAKEQVYDRLSQEVENGTGEIFERVLADRLTATQQRLQNSADELQQAKATRSLRAMQTIQAEWQRWQQNTQADRALETAVQQVGQAPAERQFSTLLQVLDPNRSQPIAPNRWRTLAAMLQESARDDRHLLALADGIRLGLESWQGLADHLVSWIYDQQQGFLGFASLPEHQGPWGVWSKQVKSPFLKSFFEHLAYQRSVADWPDEHGQPSLAQWVELALVLRGIQQGLVEWFDQLVYNAETGAKLSISTYVTFAVIWSQLASGLARQRGDKTRDLVQGAFQITLQTLRTFSQRSYFPLYGGLFASFSGRYLRGALDYLDAPLNQAEGTQEKARILTVIAYSLRTQGRYDRAAQLHQQALEIATAAGDAPCQIANLNHLSRLAIARKNYGEAIDFSQRALIFSRQGGDRRGEANALANLGYAEVLRARQIEQSDADVYDQAIYYLHQGLTLSERLADQQSQSLCLTSLGLAYLLLEQPAEAIPHLEQGSRIARQSGDLYLQGLNWAYLGEGYYQQQQHAQAVCFAALGMYLLEQIGAIEWRQAAGLLVVLQGQMAEQFTQALQQERSQIVAAIGVDGFDHLQPLLNQYRQE